MDVALVPSRNPTFDRPPITEIGVGIVFHRPNFLTTAHLGRFWERVSSDLPLAQDHSPTGLPPDWGISVEGLPLPRLWFMETSGAAVLQLQVARIDFNWRRQNPSDQYPNFAVHTRRLMRYWAQFSEFVSEQSTEPLVVRSAEVSKVSQIKEGEGWQSLRDLGYLFPAFSLATFGDPWDLKGVGSVLDFVHPEGKVRADLKTGIAEPGRRVLVLEIRAEAQDLDATSLKAGNLEERLTLANELANLTFTSLTSPEVQKSVWGRTS